jgi:hypothetical protein
MSNKYLYREGDGCPRCTRIVCDPWNDNRSPGGDDGGSLVITAIIASTASAAIVAFLNAMAEEAGRDAWAWAKRLFNKPKAVLDDSLRPVEGVTDETHFDGLRLVDEDNRITIEIPRHLPEKALKGIHAQIAVVRSKADDEWLVVSYVWGSWRITRRIVVDRQGLFESWIQVATLLDRAQTLISEMEHLLANGTWTPTPHDVRVSRLLQRRVWEANKFDQSRRTWRQWDDSYVPLLPALGLVDALRVNIGVLVNGESPPLKAVFSALQMVSLAFQPVYFDIYNGASADFIRDSWPGLEERLATAHTVCERFRHALALITPPVL